jgi:hypothetical protein
MGEGMKARIVFLFAWIVIASFCSAAPCRAQNSLNGLYHLNMQSNDVLSSSQIDFILTTIKWQVSLADNKLSITEFRERLDDTGQPAVQKTALRIKDFDFKGGRLHVLVEEVLDQPGFGVGYLTSLYDLRFDPSGESASGQWKSEYSRGANDPYKVNEAGTVALRRLESNTPQPTKQGGLTIER